MMNIFKKIFSSPLSVCKSIIDRILGACLSNRRVANVIYSLASRSVLRDKAIRDFRPSVIYSKEDVKNSAFLMETCVGAIKQAWITNLDCGKKNLFDSDFLNVFPGEHYRLISSIVNLTKASNIVEIGTFTGLGTLSLRDGMCVPGKVTTYDIFEWDKLGLPSHFDEDDFKDGRINQIIGNLAEDSFFEENIHLLNEADIIFLDAPKDDIFEYKMIAQFIKLNKKKNKLLIVDDIQFVNMVDFWRGIVSPKLDMSSFGHWSGTGVVDISEGLKYR